MLKMAFRENRFPFYIDFVCPLGFGLQLPSSLFELSSTIFKLRQTGRGGKPIQQEGNLRLA
jgi:hypothetical protein